MPRSNYNIAEYLIVRNTRLAIVAHPVFFTFFLAASYCSAEDSFDLFVIGTGLLLLATLRWYATSLYLSGKSKHTLRFLSVYGFIPTGIIWGIGGMKFLLSNQIDLFILHSITSISFAAHGTVNFSPIRKIALSNVLLLTTPLVYWSVNFSNVYSTIYILLT